MILSTIRMAISPEKYNEALRILILTAELSKIMPGCMEYFIYKDVQESNVLMIMEMWESSEYLMQFHRSEEYLNVLIVMEMAEKDPMLRFDTISKSTGIETVEKARMSEC
jgi:quinol monooxygenase YgiN